MPKEAIMSDNPMDISKGIFVTAILQDIPEIVAFQMFLGSGTPTANAVKLAWDSSFNVTVGAPFVDGLVGALVPAVLSQAVLDRYNAKKAELIAAIPAPPAPAPDPGPLKLWRIEFPTQAEAEAWLPANTTLPYNIEGGNGGVIEFTTTEAMPAPAVEA